MANGGTSMQYLTSLPRDESIVSMVEVKGKLVVATTKQVYTLNDDVLEVLEWKYQKER